MPGGRFLAQGTASNVADHFRKQLRYRSAPSEWIHTELGEETWSKQDEVCASVAQNRFTAVPSCHDVGKSYIASRIAAWWIATKPIGDAFVVTTAPSASQVRVILWRELARAHRKAGLPGTITSGQVPEWKIDGEIVAYGRKPQDLKSKEEAMQAFQGVHARYVLVILDEACGIPSWLWDAVSALVTNEDSRVVAIGNPDNPESRFRENCAPGTKWNTIRISAFDWLKEAHKHSERLRQMLVSQVWIDEAIDDWGIDSPLYASKVLGQFPDVSDDMLITPAMIEKAHLLDLPGTKRGNYGLDVAREGADESALYRNRDGVVRLEWAVRGLDTVEVAKKTANTAVMAAPVVVDSIGLGAGVYDQLKKNHRVPVIEYKGSHAPIEPERFVNRRAEDFWHLRELMKVGGVDLDPDDKKAAAQLQSIKWFLDRKGRIQIESKEEMAKRGAKSPDRADGIVMARVGTKPRTKTQAALLAGPRNNDLKSRPM